VTWLELSVTADLAAVEALSALFEQHGEGGVAIDQPFFTDVEGEHFGIDSTRPALIRTYLPDTAEGAARLTRVREGLWHLQAFNLAPIADLQVRRIAEEDWANTWKEHYHPLRIGRLLIKPSWRAAEVEPDVVVVEIDPGMAFGTGIHQTTRMCLTVLERLLEPGVVVLDQGTGSGILAVSAAKLGASRVMARDIAEVAVEAATANAIRNGVGDRIQVRRVHGSDSPADQVFLEPDQPAADLILANIVASVIMHLAEALAAAGRPGATLIASGIIRERRQEVEDALKAVGFSTVERLAEDEWVTLTAKLLGSPSLGFS
jgi:ribosomal protein L11 methyltransferase